MVPGKREIFVVGLKTLTTTIALLFTRCSALPIKYGNRTAREMSGGKLLGAR